MKGGSFGKNCSFLAPQNAVEGHYRFPNIVGGLQKKEKTQHMATTTPATKFPKIQKTSNKLPKLYSSHNYTNMKGGSFGKNCSFLAPQNAVEGHYRFPKIVGGLQKKEKTQHMATTTPATKFPKIQKTSNKLPVIILNDMFLANQGLPESSVKDPDVKPYVRYGETSSRKQSSHFLPVIRRHHEEMAAHSGRPAAQRSRGVPNTSLQPHVIAIPCDDQFSNRLKHPRTGKSHRNYF